MDLIEKVLQSNKDYWNKENSDKDSNGMLLYECFYSIPQLCYGVSKVALCIAKALNLKPAVLLPWQNADIPISESMCKTQLQMRNHILHILFAHFYVFISVFFISPKKLLKLTDGKALIGTYIYDAILRRYNKKTNNSFSFKERVFICFELCYYFYFNWIIKKYPIKVVVLGDNVYRYGLLFELCKVNNIVCYSPINLNSLFLKKFETRDDYEEAFLTKEIVEKLCRCADYKSRIEDYYKKRYEGSIQQHDVLTAYANKSTLTEEDFNSKYHIDGSKPIIVIMSHVFADAPHININPLYDDYWLWFVNTFENLRHNDKINLLVKEHPSAHLFGQKGLVREYLKSVGRENILVDENESTLSIIRNATAVVTCGGTIGLEMTYAGKNVVLASIPPYGNLGFTKNFKTAREYEEFLLNHIQDMEPLSKEQHENAVKASYVSFCCQNNWSGDLELGGDVILLNKKYDDNVLLNNILDYNMIPLANQKIYSLLETFIKSGDKGLFNS